jgi:hypothetical protein
MVLGAWDLMQRCEIGEKVECGDGYQIVITPAQAALDLLALVRS